MTSKLESPYEPPEWLNLADHLLDARVREGRGERVALRTDDGTLTYAEVQALSRRRGQALRDVGVRPEERVLIALRDGPEFVGVLFGVLRIGGVGVMVNPDLSAEEIAALLEYTGARWAVVGDDVRPTFGAAVDGADRLERILGPDDLDGTDEDGVVVRTHRDDPALWLFSGGTTGRPKAVVQTHGSFANTTELYAVRTLGYGEDDVTLSIPKLFFGYATGSNLFFPFRVGGSTVLFEERPTPETLFERIARHRPTILVNVPTVVSRMLAHPDAGEADLSCLRFATSAGEALPPDLHAAWNDVFGVPLLDGLGTAEMWHVFLTNRPGDVRPGTLGRVVEGFEVRIADDDGNALPPGEVGRLWVRGSSRALGYHRHAEKTAAAFRGEWFVGGDLAVMDGEGYVTYAGRDDDVVKVGGKWLVPREVEDCLLGHPAVEECAVVAARDADGLTKPYAFVLVEPDAVGDDLGDELREWCLERLRAYKHPRRVTVMDELPRTHLGKIDRGALKRRAEVATT